MQWFRPCLWFTLSVLLWPGQMRAASIEAQFGGCDLDGRCLFRIETKDGTSTIHVLPDGVASNTHEYTLGVAVRDRLNALLSNMIHQHKHIVLTDLRSLQDGRLGASVTINGVALASDQLLRELRERILSTNP